MRTKLRDGKRVPLTDEENAARDAEEAAFAAAAPERELDNARRRRAGAYPPIGDQLDAIWKTVQSFADAGTQLPVQATAMLADIASVKRDNPIPDAP
jgi:hypothetical protein